MNSQIIEVSAAVITQNNRVLLAKRTGGYLNDLWEFPGGKLEPNETPQVAAVRELKEELNINIKAYKTLLVLEHDYPDKRVRLHFINCIITENENAEIDSLKNNSDVAWFTPDTFPFGKFCPADEIAAKNIHWNKIIHSEAR